MHQGTGLKSYRPYRKLVRTPAHRRAHLRWARHYQRHTLVRWNLILMTDERWFLTKWMLSWCIHKWDRSVWRWHFSHSLGMDLWMISHWSCCHPGQSHRNPLQRSNSCSTCAAFYYSTVIQPSLYCILADCMDLNYLLACQVPWS